MKIVKKLNNNFAIGIDSRGKEIIVYGSGVGFGKLPYELTDLSKIDKTYYDVDHRNYALIKELPEEILLSVTEFIRRIHSICNVELNPNLVFSLADHINFAIQRYREGIHASLPYFYDLEYNYPEIYQLSKSFLKKINSTYNVILPKEEITSIMMHIIDAMKNEKQTISKSQQVDEIINGITDIIEKFFAITIDKDGYDYYRFKNHLKCFTDVKNSNSGETVDEWNVSMYENIKNSYPEIFQCVLSIDEFLAGKIERSCNKEELLYLMVYVNRLISKVNRI